MAADSRNDRWPYLSPTTVFTFQNAAAATQDGNEMYCGGQPSVVIQMKGAGFTGTITFEGTVDETNWVSLQAVNVATGAVAATTTADGVFVVPTGGALSKIRARVSAYTGGTVTVTGRSGVVGSRDVSSTNIAGTVTVIQATHDSLNLNANLQIANADASTANPVPTQSVRGATAAVTSTADNAASVTVSASNANLLKRVFTNDSSARAYLKYGATATTTDYTFSLAQHESYEEITYTGVVDCVWASDPNDGGLRATAITA